MTELLIVLIAGGLLLTWCLCLIADDDDLTDEGRAFGGEYE